MKSRRDVVVVENGSGAESLEAEFIRREPIIPIVHGNMIHPATLESAGIERAVAIMMLTGDDTTNLEAALVAREMNPGVRVVLRMSNKHVTQRLDAMLRRSLVRNFQLIDSVEGSAPRCLEMCRPLTEPPSVLCSIVSPLNLGEATGHVIICGLGRLGFGIVRLLKGRLPLVVIDHSDRPHYADEPEIVADPVVPILRGDMTSKRVLQQAGITRAAAVLIMTPNDTQNLETAMLTHELNPRVPMVMRISNSRISQRLDRVLREVFGETLRVIDPSEHAAPHFVEAVSAAYEQTLHPRLLSRPASASPQVEA